MKKIIVVKNVTSILIIIIMTLVLTINVLAESLTEPQKVRIMEAVDLLDSMGEKEWSEDIKEWLKKELIESSSEISDNAKTTSQGKITVRKDLLEPLTAVQQNSPLEVWKANIDLARLLIHEKVHAHYQAPDSHRFSEDAKYKKSDWLDSGVVYKVCTGPEATEIEAYYKFLLELINWWEDLYNMPEPELLSGQELANFRQDKQEKMNFLKKLINDWIKQLKSLNYEKGSYLKDFFDVVENMTGKTDYQKMVEKKSELKKRIDGQFDEEGYYGKARKAAANSRSEVRTMSGNMLYPQPMFINNEAIMVSVPENSPENEIICKFSLYSDYIKPKAGYTHIPIGELDSTVFSIETVKNIKSGGENYRIEIMSELLAHPDIALYKFGYEKPAGWERVDNQTIYQGDGYIEARLDDGIYGLMVKNQYFEDINTNNKYYDNIAWLVENGKVKGIEDGIFGSGKSLTRAEYATLLVRVLELDIVEKNIYKDVLKDNWYAKYVATISQEKIMQGVGNQMFSPKSTINMEQMITTIIRAANLEDRANELSEIEIASFLSGIEDVDIISGWARKYVAQAVRAGIWKKANNNGGVYFKAKSIVTRDEAVNLMYNLNFR